MSRRVPLQRLAAQGKYVYWQVHLQEHVARLPLVVYRALALQAAHRMLSC